VIQHASLMPSGKKQYATLQWNSWTLMQKTMEIDDKLITGWVIFHIPHKKLLCSGVYLSHWKTFVSSICNCNIVHVILGPRLNIKQLFPEHNNLILYTSFPGVTPRQTFLICVSANFHGNIFSIPWIQRVARKHIKKWLNPYSDLQCWIIQTHTNPTTYPADL
jgi:hypothetical protein